MTNHIDTLSGGGGSWLKAKITRREFVKPGDTHLLVFTDTLYEDADAYRFLIEGALNIFGRKASWVPAAEDFPDYRVEGLVDMATYKGNPAWREFLAQVRARTLEELPELVWLVEGRDVWEVYRDERFLGNSRRDPCSKITKRQPLDAWMCETFGDQRDDTVVYFGISTGERHRYDGIDPVTKKPIGIKHRWAVNGWNAQAPLIDRIEGDLSPALYMAHEGIKRARNYRYYDHDNCGGGCSKMGIAPWLDRLAAQPDRFEYDAMMEEAMGRFLGRKVSFLTDRRGGKRVSMTLRELEARKLADPNMKVRRRAGDTGCGCMTEIAGAEL